MKSSRLLVALGLSAAMALSAQAQQFFRIGTGGTAGTYYPVGGMIANSVSQPGKLVVTAQAWTVDNDLITPTFKVKRNRIEDLYASRYETWVGARKTVIWEG